MVLLSSGIKILHERELVALASDLAAPCCVQEKLIQRGIHEQGLERREAIDRILAMEGANTSR